MARNLINLCCCRLGLTNLNALVMIYNNWLEDAKKKDVGGFFTFEGDVLEVHEDKLDQSSYFEDDLLQYIPYRHGFDFNLSLQFSL